MQNSRRKFLRKSLWGTAALGVAPYLSSCKQSPVKLTILHTNDVHSQIDPFPPNHSRWPNQGGFARRAELISKIREEEEQILLLDSGDIFQGTPYFNIYKGKLEIDLMNKMGYDAATLGNHEFDNGIEALAGNVERARFPFVCSNYDFSDTVLKGATIPYKVFNKGAVKIGIIGLGIELAGLVNPKSYEKTKYDDPVEIGNKLAKLLKEEKKCDLVIALSHLGYRYKTTKVSDVVVAQQTRHIDIILGGHTHTFMEKPDMVKNMDDKEVLVNQVGWGGMYLGRLDLEMVPGDSKQTAIINSIYHV